VQHLTPDNPIFNQRLEQITQYLAGAGSSAADASQKAYGMVSSLANQQAAFLGSLDCFHVLGWVALGTLVLALLTKPYRSPGSAGAH
jgi:DHA2 family multidrug resistance protein